MFIIPRLNSEDPTSYSPTKIVSAELQNLSAIKGDSVKWIACSVLMCKAEGSFLPPPPSSLHSWISSMCLLTLSLSFLYLPIYLSITVCLPTYLNTYLEKEGERDVKVGDGLSTETG